MRWCSFTTATGGGARLGAVSAREESRVLDVGAWARSRDAAAPADLVDLIEASEAIQERVTDLVRSAPEDGLGWIRLDEVTFLAPVRTPNSLRDFLAFRDHVEHGAKRRGTPVPEAWDRIPVYYKGNRRSILGPDDVVPWPSYTDKLDYECEVAAIVGRGGRDVATDDAESYVFGYTVMNDWSARDIQKDEMSCWLGPAKGKDFATSLGPVLVTPDELDGSSGEMVARVNGEERSRGNLASMFHKWDALLAQAARNTVLAPGDVVGSGTVGSGCILEHGDGRWLQRGDVVELELEGIGVLRNTVA